MAGHLGAALAVPSFGYSFVYHIEIGLLFLTLVVLGPLVRIGRLSPSTQGGPAKIGLADLPA
jgi:BCD family chlorophyll transporter-like MFS transporter